MLRFIKLLPLVFLITVAASCKKDSTSTTPPANVNFAATLSGASETPSNASAATGSATGVYNPTTKILTVTIAYSGITVTVAHLHKGAVGVSGPPEFPLAVTASPISFTSSALSTTDETDLLENKYYVNLHSSAFPGGEIRGQLNKQ